MQTRNKSDLMHVRPNHKWKFTSVCDIERLLFSVVELKFLLRFIVCSLGHDKVSKTGYNHYAVNFPVCHIQQLARFLRLKLDRRYCSAQSMCNCYHGTTFICFAYCLLNHLISFPIDVRCCFIHHNFIVFVFLMKCGPSTVVVFHWH